MEAIDTDVAVTLQPSSTYVAVDRAGGPGTQRIFTTTASGDEQLAAHHDDDDLGRQGGFPSRGSSASRSRPIAARSAPWSPRPARRRSRREPGRTCRWLKAGRYDITVLDAEHTRGFFVARRAANPVAITSLAFKGRRGRVVTLTAGQWSFYSKIGKPTPFIVVSA